MNRPNTPRSINYIAKAAMIAAIYAGLTYALSALSYGPIQFRFSEALMILPVFTPTAIPGLTLGCFLSNLGSPYGLFDILGGSAATLLAALWAYFTRKITIKGCPLLAPIGAVVFNGLIVGGIIAFISKEIAVFYTAAPQIALGELAVCYLLGIPLWYVIERSKLKIYLSL